MTKAQFNSGKVNFDETAQKVNLVDPDACTHCPAGQTPSAIGIELQGLVDCGCVSVGTWTNSVPCTVCGSPIHNGRIDGDLIGQVEGKHILPQQANNCLWSKNLSFTDVNIHIWEDLGDACANRPTIPPLCEGDPCQIDNIPGATLSVIREADHLLVRLRTANFGNIFAAELDCSVVSPVTCVNCTGEYTGLVDCDNHGDAIMPGFDVGSVAVWDASPCRDSSEWSDLTFYAANSRVRGVGNNSCYQCYLDHTSSTINEPGVGDDWTDFWDELITDGL